MFNGGQWTHVAVTIDTTTKYVRHYVNGVLTTGAYVASLTSLPALAGNTSISNINNDDSGTYTWSGGLDDVRIYNRTLSTSEIQDLYISTNIYATGDCLDSSGAVNPTTVWYLDADGDGYANGVTTKACTDPGATYYLASQLTATTGDCNDSQSSAYPGAAEICDSLDNDCDSIADDGIMSTYYLDADGDTYSSGATSQQCLERILAHWTFDNAN